MAFLFYDKEISLKNIFETGQKPAFLFLRR
jgi:hypothetical protein